MKKRSKKCVSLDNTSKCNKELWFRAKYYGWGWYPCCWEGWLALFIWAILFALIVGRAENETRIILKVFIPALILTIALIILCFIKGEKPRWRWGRY